jgi:hypothetical protein
VLLTKLFDLQLSHSVALHVDFRQPLKSSHPHYFLHLTYLIILEFNLVHPKPAQPLYAFQASYLVIVQLHYNPRLLIRSIYTSG